MPEISEYKTQIEEIQKRRNGTSGQGEEGVGALKQRMSAVRSSLLQKQEIIDEQAKTIEEQGQTLDSLRAENAQLSELLKQALAALEADSTGSVDALLADFDSQFSELLGEVAQVLAAEAPPVQDEPRPPLAVPVPAEPAESAPARSESAQSAPAEPAEAEPNGAEPAVARAAQDERPGPGRDGGRRGAPAFEGDGEPASPALRRIMGRHRR